MSLSQNREAAGNINSARPNQIDVSNLDDFERLVKDVIDSLYENRVSKRDSLTQIKDERQKILDGKVAQIEALETSVEDEELVVETDIAAPDLMDEIYLNTLFILPEALAVLAGLGMNLFYCKKFQCYAFYRIIY